MRLSSGLGFSNGLHSVDHSVKCGRIVDTIRGNHKVPLSIKVQNRKDYGF